MESKRHYVRHRQYFFTLFTAGQRPHFASQHSVDVLRAAFAQAMRKYPFEMDAVAILPDHLHCLWTLPAGDEETSRRWRVIKFWFSNHCEPILREKSESLWGKRFCEHPIRDERDYLQHIDFIHYNPVRHALAETPADWPHSSFERYVQMGWLEPAWGETEYVIAEWVGYE
jgi:putative transposase